MFCEPATGTEVMKIISNLSNNKSPGPDNIGPKLLKLISGDIIVPLLFMFNLSLSTGEVPVFKKCKSYTIV